MYIAMYVIWAIIAILGIIIEINTAQQFGWAAAIASLCALITHTVLGKDQIWAEFIVFFSIWITLWICLWIILIKLKKKLHDKEDGYLNFVGQTIKVTKNNEKEFGEAKLNGKIFRLKSKNKLKIGDKVIVEKVKGVTLIVKKVGK